MRPGALAGVRNVVEHITGARVQTTHVEVNLQSDRLFRKVAGEDDKEVMAFYHQISDFGTAFNQWLKKL